ncbi:Grx4 family monothiol glutaredoxin [Holosporaceae bacterium 'Namur']|nr:Grx4 family monothiol glutaredoxin [Holosporaceae bacterium 'Namur']
MDEVLSQIKNEIENNDIVLFLKGTANMPQCGFSGVVVQILNRLELPFKDINILESEELRQGIKEYSNWPTIPQLYIKREFIGGCDIVREMYLSGQLQNLLQEKGLK